MANLHWYVSLNHHSAWRYGRKRLWGRESFCAQYSLPLTAPDHVFLFSTLFFHSVSIIVWYSGANYSCRSFLDYIFYLSRFTIILQKIKLQHATSSFVQMCYLVLNKSSNYLIFLLGLVKIRQKWSGFIYYNKAVDTFGSLSI